MTTQPFQNSKTSKLQKGRGDKAKRRQSKEETKRRRDKEKEETKIKRKQSGNNESHITAYSVMS